MMSLITKFLGVPDNRGKYHLRNWLRRIEFAKASSVASEKKSGQ